ncbi:MAG: hypothetical protein ACD_54C01327G0002 [uncultured bacterium]|nr:MAG: hypothetical protein ACD_54C01327G0002 [uncultured bacterium]
MRFDLQALIAAVRLTLRDPRGAARIIIGMRLPGSVGWAAMTLMVVASALLSSVSAMIFPMDLPPELTAMFSSPFRLAEAQAIVLGVGLMLIHGVGRMFGGTGRFSDALLLMAWMEALLILLQVLQMVAMLLLPPLASMLGFLGIAVFVWLLVNFVGELHGFGSLLKVFLAFVGTILAISFAMAFVMAAVVGMGG